MKLPVVFVVTFLARAAVIGTVPIREDLDTRVVGGQNAERDQFPFMVLFNWCIDADFCQFVCGASILTPNRVLTAAHCITEVPPMGTFAVRAGILLLTDPASVGQLIAVESTLVHPNYAGGVGPNDIAMANLASSFTFNSAVQPVVLPTFQSIPTGTATLMGWGSILPNISLPWIPDQLQYIGAKEILTLTLLGAVQSGGSAAGNSLSESFNRGPHFDTSASKNVTALLGKTAYLNCRVKNLANRTVSWVRHRDVHLLTVGHYTYTSDQRFRAIHQPHSEDWTLQIKYPQHRDSGVYECQVSSTPHLSHFIHLTVIEPDTEIVGGPELFIDRGSTINLTCVVRHSPEPPAYIFWNHNDVIISYASSRGGVSVATERGDTSRSVLLIQKARPTDSGNYQCNPSNARPANVTVHVLNGEHPEAMQHGGNQRMASTVNVFALFSIVMLTYC